MLGMAQEATSVAGRIRTTKAERRDPVGMVEA